MVLPVLLHVFHCFLGCLLTETGLDQEGLELILFLFSLDLKAMIAIMVRFATVFTLDTCLELGDQGVVVQLSLASSASMAFSSSPTLSFARAFSSFVTLGIVTNDPKVVLEEVLNSFLRQHNTEDGELSAYTEELISHLLKLNNRTQ